MAAAVTIAGGIIGGMVGAPNVGIILGSILGNLLFPPKGQDTVGPRLSDLKIQTSTYGTSVPTVYGRTRLSGNVIFSTEKKEHEHKEQQGGLKGGGGGPTSTTFTYTVTMAVALCEGPIAGVPKIWANGKLIYNVSDTASSSTIINSGLKAKQIRFYRGTDTQMPDPAIESIVGKENTSAYRGTAYIVFEDLDITEWGNIPNLEFEVNKSGDPHFSKRDLGKIGRAQNKINQIIQNGILVVNSSKAIEENPLCWVFSDYGNGKMYIARILNQNGDTQILKEIKHPNPELKPPYSNFLYKENNYNDKVIVVIDGLGDYYLIDENGQVTFLCSKDNIRPFKYSQCYDNNIMMCKFKNGGFGYEDGAYFYDSNNLRLIGFIADKDLISYNNIYPVASKSYLYILQPKAGGELIIKKYSRSDFRYLGTIDNSILPSTPDFNSINKICTFNDKLIYNGSIKDESLYYLIDINSIEILKINGFTANEVKDTSAQILYTYLVDNFFYNKDYLYSYNFASTDITLDVIIIDQFLKSGQSLDLIDVSELADITIHGYLIAKKDAIRSNIERLLQLYFVDCVESDGVIKFVKRGGNIAVTIPEEDLSVHGYGTELPDNMLIERIQNVDLPSKLVVTYMDLDGSFQIGSQYASRQATNGVQNIKTVEAPITLKADEAKRMSDILLQEAWQGRNTITIQIGSKYCYIEPTDIIQTYKYGSLYTLRVLEIDEQNNIYILKCITEDVTKYTQEAIGAPLPKPDEEVKGPEMSFFFDLDIPLLRDQDDGLGCYIATSGSITNKKWGGCVLYESLDKGISFQQYKTTGLLATTGFATTKLQGFYSGYVIDKINKVIVRCNKQLESIDINSLFNNANGAIIGNEIIQFQNAVLIADGMYELSNLIRGKFGTEQYIMQHNIGDRFVLLESSSIDILKLSSADYDKEKIFKAVSPGTYEDTTAPNIFTYRAVAQECYSPVHLGGGRDNNGNAYLKWIRRGRLNNSWNDKIDVPLGEDIESYEIDILDGSNKVKRTIKSDKQSAIYTIEDQIKDFGSKQTKINFNVYQMSANRGRGFPANGII